MLVRRGDEFVADGRLFICLEATHSRVLAIDVVTRRLAWMRRTSDLRATGNCWVSVLRDIAVATAALSVGAKIHVGDREFRFRGLTPRRDLLVDDETGARHRIRRWSGWWADDVEAEAPFHVVGAAHPGERVVRAAGQAAEETGFRREVTCSGLAWLKRPRNSAVRSDSDEGGPA